MKPTPPDRYEFTRTLPIAALNDTEAECLFIADGGEVDLKLVNVFGLASPALYFSVWLGTSEVAKIEAMARDWWHNEGWAAAEQDWLASVADAQNEARDDE